jgi:Fe-Mn family superoxide dismutase
MPRRTPRPSLPRREALKTLVAGGLVFVVDCKRSSERQPPPAPAGSEGESKMPVPPSLAGKHTPIALPFKASALNGISEKMITSHHDKNYVGAVNNLNKVEQQLAQTNADTPGFLVAALHEKELAFRNSKSLHEAYFANLGGNGKLGGEIEKVVAEAYGSSSKFLDRFRAAALGLGGGSGWVVLGYELDTGALRTVAATNHTQALSQAIPLLVLDMYEHSYQMDFGAAAAKYVDAFMANVGYDEVNKRWESAKRLATALKATSR